MAISAEDRDFLVSLYVGYFNRAPDPAGLQFWIDQVEAGRDTNTIAADFAASPEAKSLYPFLTTPDVSSPTSFITAVYANLFNRAPDAAGQAFWEQQLSSGAVSPADAIDAIIKGATTAPDSTILANKNTVGLDFATDAGNTPGFTFDLNGASGSAATSAIAGVTEDASTVIAAQAATDAYLNGVAGVGETLMLTAGVDNLTGTTGNDTFIAGDTGTPVAAAWTVGDALAGGAGTDTLKVITDSAITAAPVGATLSGIEVVDVVSGKAVTLDASSFADVNTLKVTNTAAAQTLTASATQDVMSTANARTSDNVVVNGGKDVSVTATSTVAGGDITVGNTLAPKGAVTVSNTISGAANILSDDIKVTGGTTVDITSVATNSNLTGTTVNQSDVTVTGTADTTSATVKQSADVAAVAAAPAVTAATETAVVTWQDFAVDGTQSIDGMTITNASGGAITAAQVATVAGGGTVTGVTITTAPTAWTVSTATGATNVFTSTTPNSNVTDVDATSGSSGVGNTAPTAVVTDGSAGSAAVTGVGGIAAGDVTVTDVNAASTTAAGTITTASLENFGAATVNSGALTTLNLAGKGGSVNAGTLGALTTAANSALAVNANGLTTTGAVTIDTDITTLNVASSTAKSTIATLTANGAKSINVSGDAVLAVTANNLTALTDITVTNTAGFQLGGAAINTAATFTGGAGADAVALGATTKAITMGAGDDKVTSAGLVGTGGSVAAGDGTDTIVMTSGNAANADDDAVFNSKFTGFEVLEVSDALTANINLTGINGVSSVTLAGGSTGTISNLASGGTVKLTANSTTLAVDVKDAIFNASDVLNLNLSKAGVLTAGAVTAAGVETVNIASADAVAAGSAAVINTMTLTAADATTITVAGNNGLDLSASVAAKVTTFDASGVVGNGAADTAANLAVNYVSDNATTTATVSITGGAGNDVLTGNAAKDTINGGEGNDVITGGAGIDVMTGGAGRDTFKIASGEAGITGAEKITDFALGLTGDTIDLDAIGIVADQTATNVTAQVSGAVDVTATVKDGIITIGGADAGLVDTLGEFKAIFETIDAGGADSAAFAFGGNTYVISGNGGAATDIIQLVGLSGATSLATTAADGAILIA